MHSPATLEIVLIFISLDDVMVRRLPKRSTYYVANTWTKYQKLWPRVLFSEKIITVSLSIIRL